MPELTVGQVAGLLAFAVFIFKLWIPTFITAVPVVLLMNEHNAATWSFSPWLHCHHPAHALC
ncbi:hypothetical protein BJX63DRAFT_387127 [Aspergillus granulosus]|uniref:Uncharacterized protein n=1 Tax=Aspergillus granulosus TaxID=176169 RepID=A0ABR4HMI2_9EURO